MRRSKEEMFPLLEEWENCNESREAFCQRHHLQLSTFGYWRTKYVQANKLPRASGFVKLSPPLQDPLEVEYPNGVKLRLPANTSLADLQALIQLV